MTQQAKHTELPWVVGLDMPQCANNNPDKRFIWSGSMFIGDFVSPWVSREIQEANAEFAIRAANSHYQLLAACERCELLLLQMPSQTRPLVDPILEEVRAAISAAKELNR